MLVAVYGTLKRGYGNNRLLSSSEFVCDDLVKGFLLNYSGSPGSFPVAMPDENSSIKVEVWNIGDDESTLRSLDSLEGVPYMYERHTVQTEDGLTCEMYVGTDSFWNEPRGSEWERIHNKVPHENGVYEWRRAYV